MIRLFSPNAIRSHIRSAFRLSKRVVKLKNEKIGLEQQSAEIRNAIDLQQIPDDWQHMGFDQLCGLSPATIQAIELSIRKSKFSGSEDMFRSSCPSNDPQQQLNEHWKSVCQTLCGLRGLSNEDIEQLESNGSLATMSLEDPLEDQDMLLKISRFVGNLKNPAKLQAIAQPTFARYVLGLRRDLLMRGVDIDLHGAPKIEQLRCIKILNYEHEFWADVHHNRSKNGTADRFIVSKKVIANPNSTVLLTDKWPELEVTYITSKKKKKAVEMSFVTKLDVLIEVDNHKHVVRLEKKGPKSTKNPDQYWVIDYDFLMAGNPTIKPVFQF